MAYLDHDPEKWGPGTWITITMKALRARTPARISIFIENDVPVLVTLLCNTCSGHSKTIIANRHPNEYRNIVDERGELIGMFAWIVDIHNDVNNHLGKSEVSWKHACQMFGPLLSMTKLDFELESKLITNPDTIKDIPIMEYPMNTSINNNKKIVPKRNKYIPRTKNSRVQTKCTKCTVGEHN